MTETSYSAKFGVETYFSGDIPSLLYFNIYNGGFDFVLAPLMNPLYRPSLVDKSNLDSHFLPFAGSDIVVTPSEWSSRVIGKISTWIDVDSDDEVLRMDSETTLKQEIEWANHLSLRACLLPTPKGTSFANYARIVKQILQGRIDLELWLRIPLWDPIDPTDSWKLWNSFRSLCDHNSELFVALDIGIMLPYNNSLGRWFGESVKAAIISTECFIPIEPSGQCDMLQSYQELTTRFFHDNVQIIISGRRHVNITEGRQAHPQKPHLDYVLNLFHSMKPLSEQEHIVFHNRDRLCKLFQPLRENLEAIRYEKLERDDVKYSQYRKAIAKALEDRVPNGKASELTTVLMVVGAGRGALVWASLQAAEDVGRKLKVYAVEKNPNAVVSLHDLVKQKGWEGTVIVISCDMRFWSAPERADILVSDLMGSFGDNELSPECLDGAQRFLKPDGISIPSSYTSFIQPITTSKVYNAVKALKNLSPLETAYSVKLHSVATLAPVQPVFTFVHPNLSRKMNNQYYKKLRFDLPKDMGSTLVHGFAGYFEAVLYDDVHVSTKPTTATQNMITWFPMFFPLSKPVEVPSKSPIEAHFWRCRDSTKVWYEWTVTWPTVLPIHNTNGHSYWIGL